MLFLILQKAFYTLKIFQQFRTLIVMILACMRGMVPFLVTMMLMTITFAMVDLSLDREEYLEQYCEDKTMIGKLSCKRVPLERFGTNFLNQYTVLFGENPEIPDGSNSPIRWGLYISFTILMNIVMLNLLISIISDSYDQVQSCQKSTDLRAKCGILWDFGQLEIFFRKWFFC